MTNTGTIEVKNDSTLVLSDDTVTNSVTIASGTTIGIIQVDATDLAHSHFSTLDLDNSTIQGGKLIISGELVSTGDSFITGTAITNSGIIDVTSGILTIDATSTFVNTGTLESDGGTLIIDAAFSGNLEIKGAALLELGSTLANAYSSATVTFDPGSTGTLKLDHSGTFGGQVAGLDDNKIDLADISYGTGLTAAYAGTATSGILSIFVNGNDVSDIHLTGDYLGVRWQLADDGSAQHATTVTEIPGLISGLDAQGNSTEGSPISASITDGGALTNATYAWQVFNGTSWIPGSGQGVSTANYTPGETDEGNALRVSISYTDAQGNSESALVSAGTVIGTADTPVISTPTPVTTTEDVPVKLAGLSVSTTDGSDDAADTFSATLYVDHGTLSVGTGLNVTITGGNGDNAADAVVITGSLANVNAALAAITYTPTSEFEGTDTVHFTALSTEEGTVGSNISAAATPTVATITVTPVSDTPSVAATTSTVSLNENDSNIAISGVSVTPATGDATDPVTVTLHVANGTLSLDGTADLAASVGANGTGTVTVTGVASDVNTVLGTLKYTPTGEYEGSDTLQVTAISTDGTAVPSAPSAQATVALTVAPVSDTPSVAATTPTVTLNENDTNVAIAGVSVTPATGDETDPVTVTLHVTSGTLHLDGSLDALATIGTGTNDTNTVTVTGLASDVNTVLASLTYTANSEFEGSDTLQVTATSTDAPAAASLPSAAATVALTVAPVSDAPSVAAANSTVSLNENDSNIAISGISVTPATGDATDPVTVTLQVANGTLSLDNSGDPAATVGASNTNTVTVTGLASDVNAVLGTLKYTPASGYEGSDTLYVSATSKDGNAPASAPSTNATVALTVNHTGPSYVSYLDGRYNRPRYAAQRHPLCQRPFRHDHYVRQFDRRRCDHALARTTAYHGR